MSFSYEFILCIAMVIRAHHSSANVNNKNGVSTFIEMGRICGSQHADTRRKYIDNLIYTQVIEEIKPTYEERNLLFPPEISSAVNEMCRQFEPKFLNIIEKLMIQNKKN
ncbi:uncharacterized protein LOC131219348 [Magnolia sinica]|uniref:uncharacterized protein LOC131219348 n=1 Tax=Magnolia sinica TaxID=86752 RepID=UPI00265A72A1|nr:uncharacterized protein LOC131219348 [Magnolia sinica]